MGAATPPLLRRWWGSVGRRAARFGARVVVGPRLPRPPRPCGGRAAGHVARRALAVRLTAATSGYMYTAVGLRPPLCRGTPPLRRGRRCRPPPATLWRPPHAAARRGGPVCAALRLCRGSAPGRSRRPSRVGGPPRGGRRPARGVRLGCAAACARSPPRHRGGRLRGRGARGSVCPRCAVGVGRPRSLVSPCAPPPPHGGGALLMVGRRGG